MPEPEIDQMEMFPHIGTQGRNTPTITIQPTTAMQHGDTHITQCAWCGLLVCASTKLQLGRCPAPHHQDFGWWDQHLPVGPFRDAE